MKDKLGKIIEAKVIGNINDPDFAEQMRKEQSENDTEMN